MSRIHALLSSVCVLLLASPFAAAEDVNIAHLSDNPADAWHSRDNRETLTYFGMQLYFDDRDDLLDKALELKEESEALKRARGAFY